MIFQNILEVLLEQIFKIFKVFPRIAGPALQVRAYFILETVESHEKSSL